VASFVNGLSENGGKEMLNYGMKTLGNGQKGSAQPKRKPAKKSGGGFIFGKN